MKVAHCCRVCMAVDAGWRWQIGVDPKCVPSEREGVPSLSLGRPAALFFGKHMQVAHCLAVDAGWRWQRGVK